jgi:hypothetical protein
MKAGVALWMFLAQRSFFDGGWSCQGHGPQILIDYCRKAQTHLFVLHGVGNEKYIAGKAHLNLRGNDRNPTCQAAARDP